MAGLDNSQGSGIIEYAGGNVKFDGSEDVKVPEVRRKPM